MMIGVFNRLVSIVFRFHYHSQKMIGSLGLYTWNWIQKLQIVSYSICSSLVVSYNIEGALNCFQIASSFSGGVPYCFAVFCATLKQFSSRRIDKTHKQIKTNITSQLIPSSPSKLMKIIISWLMKLTPIYKKLQYSSIPNNKKIMYITPGSALPISISVS